MARIIVAESEPMLATQLRGLTQRFGEDVLHARNSDEVLALVAPPEVADILILDDSLGSDVLGVLELLSQASPPVIWVSKPCAPSGCAEIYRRGISYNVIKPHHPRELLSCVHATLQKQVRIVCIGGGAGLYTLLLGLKALPRTHLTSIVSVSDDGGSSGRIRDSFGRLPPGDIRRSLVALSSAPDLMKKIMSYRFSRGEGLVDHNLGNLLLTAMSEITGSDAEGIRAMGDVLTIQGIVLPVGTAVNELCAKLEDGTVIRGERNIDVPDGRDPALRIVELWQDPPIEANPNAISSILAADLVTIGPGDLFTSVIANLKVGEIPDALRQTRARVVYLCNLMSKPGETAGYSACDHVRDIVANLGEGVLDDVVVSVTQVDADAERRYAELGQEVVSVELDALRERFPGVTVWEADIGSAEELVRHDPEKLAAFIADMLGLSA